MSISRKVLTEEQKIIRGRRMLAKLVQQELMKEGYPDPFPRKKHINNNENKFI